MLKTRIIPCLDVDKGRVVKGINFISLRDAGDPLNKQRFIVMRGQMKLHFLTLQPQMRNVTQ